MIGMLFLDVAKAFNCMKHLLLYKKMKDVGMADQVIKSFRSYLSRTWKKIYGGTEVRL